MAAICDEKNSLNLEGLAEELKKVLPSYARPRFIRILSELPMTGKNLNSSLTFWWNWGDLECICNIMNNNNNSINFVCWIGTFKLKKKDLQQDAFDIKKVSSVLSD